MRARGWNKIEFGSNVLLCFRRILLFPRGNNQRESVSIYLEVADPASHGLPDDWHVCAQFSLVLSNPEDSTNFYANRKPFSLYTVYLND